MTILAHFHAMRPASEIKMKPCNHTLLSAAFATFHTTCQDSSMALAHARIQCPGLIIRRTQSEFLGAGTTASERHECKMTEMTQASGPDRIQQAHVHTSAVIVSDSVQSCVHTTSKAQTHYVEGVGLGVEGGQELCRRYCSGVVSCPVLS